MAATAEVFPANTFCWIKKCKYFLWVLHWNYLNKILSSKMIPPLLSHYPMFLGLSHAKLFYQAAGSPSNTTVRYFSEIAATSFMSTANWTPKWKHQKHRCYTDSTDRITLISYPLYKQFWATTPSYLCHRLLVLSEHGGLLSWSFVVLQLAVFFLL